MKRFLTFTACLLLLAAIFAIPAFAAGSVTVGLKATKTTVYPGESIVVTVSVSEFADCTGGSLRVSYDTSVFDRSANSWTLSTAPIMNDPNGDAVFAYGKNSAAAVSGNVYQFTLAVKENTPRGSYDVTVTLELNDVNGSKATASKKLSITVDCNHTYDNSCDTACNICGSKREAEHIYDKGTVTKKATCTATGEKLLTCTVCKATKTETVKKADHTYDNSCDTTCKVCGAKREISHSWNKGKVTKEATCTEKGEKLLTCKVCGETKTESIKKVAHSYDNDCDTTCNSCGAERTITHAYQKTWSIDDKSHWYACSVCGDKKDAGEHSFAAEWTITEVGHGYACTVCGGVPNVQSHEYDNDCDDDCNTCGYQREVSHDYGKRLFYDAEGHWHACSICGDELEMAPHTPGDAATETMDQICLDCGYIIQPAGNHEHTMAGDWLSDELGHWFECACGELTDSVKHTWDAGMIDLENSVIIYNCTQCGYVKTEEYVPPTEPHETQPTEPTTEPAEPTEPGLEPVEEEAPFPLWILLAVLLGISVVLNIVLIICIFRKRGTGKYEN